MRCRQPGTRTKTTARDVGGFTLMELVIVVAIVGILAAGVLPLARWSVKRHNEYELQRSLRILRTAIDRYHDMAVAGLIESQPDTGGYPPDLDVLVEGVELQAEAPPTLPGAVDDFAVSGQGLVGGAGQQEGGGAGSFPGAAGAGTFDLGDRAARGGARGGAGFGNTGGTTGRSGGFGSGGRGLGGTLFGESRLSGGGSFGDRPSGIGGARRDDRPLRGPDGGPLKIVFLRRIPVDPFTGEAEWGKRCYGEEPGDTLWCGRNVFDVYSRSRGTGRDGRPYREW